MHGKHHKCDSRFQTGFLFKQKDDGRKKQYEVAYNGLPAEIAVNGSCSGFIKQDVKNKSGKKTQPCILEQFIF